MLHKRYLLARLIQNFYYSHEFKSQYQLTDAAWYF